LDQFCEQIGASQPEILEIACGPGNISSYVLKKKPGAKLFGTDLSPNMIRLAGINNPAANFEVMDCRDIHKVPKKFDAIICGFCLPYLSMREVEKLFRDFSNLSNAGAILYVSTMEDKHEHSAFKTASSGAPIYMHYYEADYLSALLEQYNFELIELVRYGPKETDPAGDIDLVVLARKKNKQSIKTAPNNI
jgi:trans-aconitate methyltransferase